MGWFDLENRVDAIRVNLKSGGHVDYQFREPHKYLLYHQGGLVLGEIGLGNGSEIESVTLTSKGQLVSKPVAPKHLPRMPFVAE